MHTGIFFGYRGFFTSWPEEKKTTNQQKRNFYSGSLIVLFKYSHFCKCKCNFPSLVAMCFSSFMWSTTIFRNFSVVGNFFPDLHRKIVYFIKIIKLFTYFDLFAFPEIPPNISFHSVFLNSCISKWLIQNSHNDFTLSHCKNKCKYVSGSRWQNEHRLSNSKPKSIKRSLV